MLHSPWTGVFALTLALGSATVPSAEPAVAQAGAVVHRAQPVVPKPPSMRGRTQGPSAGGTGYLLRDLGTPGTADPAHFAPGGAAIAFNDTGQILGSSTGTRFVGGAHPNECVLWTGTRFINVDVQRSGDVEQL